MSRAAPVSPLALHNLGIDVIRPCYISVVMKDVIETVSEVQFRSIAIIVAVALLGMLATWWILTGSASPSLTAAQIETRTIPLPEPQVRTPAPQQKPESVQPEVLIEKGRLSAVSPAQPDESPAALSVENGENGFTVQTGAFQQEEGAKKRLGELQEQGYSARLTTQVEGGKIVFRVLAGDFETREEATVAADDLKAKGIDAFVRESD